jgi:hypothetical protein
MTTTCYACHEELPIEEFAPDGSKSSGRKSICRGCDRAKSRRYYDANRERKLAYMAKRNAAIRAARPRRRRSTRDVA